MKLSVLDEHRTVQFTYHDALLQSHIIDHFRTCRQHDRFIDLEVEVDGIVFPCHRILVDSFCPYFAAYFSFHETSGWGRSEGQEEGGVERIVLKYAGVTVAGFSKLLDYMYSAALEVSAEDVIDVLRCADFLQFHHVVHLCSTFMQQQITEETCLQLLVLARTHDLHDLAERALNFILSNLSSILTREEFGQISQEVLLKIISSPYLEVDSEAVVAQAIVAWVRSKSRQRKTLLPDLLKHARIRSLDIQQLENLLSVGLTNSEFLKNSVSDHGFDDRDEDVSLRDKSLWDVVMKEVKVSTLSDRFTEVMVVVSRETERKYRGVIRDWTSLYFYDPEALRWEKLTQLPFDDRHFYAAAVLDNVLYLTGGQNLDVHDIHCTKIVFNETWGYDPVTDTWEERRSMMVPRYNHSATTLQGQMYVVGGRASTSGSSLRGDGEAYNPTTDQWTVISPVRSISGIGNAALAALDGKLYLCGGAFTTNTMDRRYHPALDWYTGAQVYDPKDDLWQELVPLEREITQSNIRISSGDMLSVEGFLLLMDDDVGKTHHLYNPVSNTASNLVQAHGHHRFGGWVVYRGQIVSTGGVEDGRAGITDMVHVWDLTQRQNGWIMATPLPQPMSHHSCVKMFLPLPRPGTGS